MGAEHAVRFIRDTRWEDLPDEVRHQAKRALLDTLGALIAGAQTPAGAILRVYALAQHPGDEATLLPTGERVSTVGAALANGFAANALDIDDGYRLIKGHPGACVLPALLAAAERATKVSGPEFLTALVVGYEVAIRAGLIRHALYSTYHSSGSWAAIGAAAAAGRILNLEDAILYEAMGTAEYHAPIAPMMKGIDTPSMGKDSIGWGAMVGMASVLLAELGFTGIRPLFDESPRRDWVEGLGTCYEVMNLYFKRFACCRWSQPAVMGSLKVAGEHGLKPGHMAAIRVQTFKAALELQRSPPCNTEQAQYHLAFPVAAALVDGEVGPRQVLPPRIFDPELLDLAARVETAEEPRYEAAFPAKALAEVEVTTRDGRTFSSGTVNAAWEPPDSLPADTELERKFRWLVEPVLGAEPTQRLVDDVWGFEAVQDVRRMLEVCTVPARPGDRFA